MLELQLSLVSFSADGTMLTVIDSTGAYNAETNPTGYGTPNKAVSSNIILRWKLYNSTTWIIIPGVSSGELASGYIITTESLGQSPTPQLLQDGVEFVQYLGLYDKGNVAGVTTGSKIVDISAHFSLSDFTGIDYITFGSDLTRIYAIVSRTATTLTLDQCYEGSNTTEEVWDAQNGDLFYLVQTYSNQQLDSKVAGVTSEQLEGRTLNNLFYKMLRLFIAQARFEQQDYYGSDLIMQNLYTECFNKQLHDRY